MPYCVAVLDAQKSFHYVPMLKAFLRKAVSSMQSKEVKELSSTLSALSNEKLKAEKDATSKKKGGEFLLSGGPAISGHSVPFGVLNHERTLIFCVSP